MVRNRSSLKYDFTSGLVGCPPPMIQEHAETTEGPVGKDGRLLTKLYMVE